MEHDLAVNDFRLELEAACWAAADVTLETLIPDSEFWAYPDQIIYKISENQVKRKTHPDGFFTLTTADIVSDTFWRSTAARRTTHDFYARRSCPDLPISRARRMRNVSDIAAGAGCVLVAIFKLNAPGALPMVKWV